MWIGLATTGVTGVIGLGLVARGLSDLRDWRALRSAAPSEDVESTDSPPGSVGGPTTVVGRADAASGTVESPVTGTPCLAYSFRVQGEHVDADADGPATGWDELGSGDGGVPFLLRGDDATLLVDPDELSVELSETETITVPSAREPPERVREFLAAQEDLPRERPSIEGPLDLRSDRHRYAEAVVEPGDRTFASGVARSRADVEGSLPQAADGRLGPSDAGGLRSRFGSLPAVVTDRPPDAFAAERFRHGVGYVGVGLVLAAVAAVLAVATV